MLLSRNNLVNLMNRKEKHAVAAASVALLAVLLWRAMPNPPKVRIGGNRIHHGLAGALLLAAGALSKRWDVAAAGAVLALDDREDLPQWLDFAEQDSRHTGGI